MTEKENTRRLDLVEGLRCQWDLWVAMSTLLVSWAALPKYHKPGALNNRQTVSEFWRLEVEILRAVREILSHASLLASGGLLATLGIPWIVDI